MKITKLQIENFRNYDNYLFEFDQEKPITLFIGANGLGKTNLLEGIYLLSLGRSFRTLESEDLIKWGSDFCRIKGEVELGGPDSARGHENLHLEVFHSIRPASKKNFRLNDVNTRLSNYIGNFLSVLFHPEDLNMLYLAPSLRRRYLDLVLCQADRRYLVALSKYRKVISQRNALLRQIREAQMQGYPKESLLEDLSAWDTELILQGSCIIEKRLKFTNFIANHLTDFYNSIADTKAEISITYSTKLNLALDSNLLEIEANYAQILLERRPLEIIRAETTIGPHRDDLAFHINGHNILSSASRGEFRTLLLAIKLAEIEFIKSTTGENPVLLLDDVFSELDLERQKHLLGAISDCQVIITATDVESIEIPEGKVKIVEL